MSLYKSILYINLKICGIIFGYDSSCVFMFVALAGFILVPEYVFRNIINKVMDETRFSSPTFRSKTFCMYKFQQDFSPRLHIDPVSR